MKDTTAVEVEIGKKTITIETGVLARQAAGSVTVRLGDTILFSAVTRSDEPREGIDFLPLQVEYREKFYAAGKFPGGFFKREARPAEKEVLTARLTDRPIRPLFPESYRNEVQINNMLLSADNENDSDVLSITAASAALMISDLPFQGPIAGVRVGRINGEFVINPTHSEREESDLDMIYCSSRDLPMMIEGSASEIPEDDMVAAMKCGQEACDKLIEAQLELAKKLGVAEPPPVEEPDNTILDALREQAGAEMSEALTIAGKLERQDKIAEIKTQAKEALLEKFEEMTDEQFRSAYDRFETELVRNNVLENDRRIDGRGLDELRELSAQVGFLPRTHGSALFNRGETQALGTLTMGTKSDMQSLDAVTGGVEEKKFMLHYNFPPYSVGEVGRLGFTNRREIGHGALAEKSLEAILPDDYPYTMRLVSDVMGSNGSSSMASVCVGTLALMDAGVPIKRPVAGISIGLFSGSGEEAKLVTDILGKEDHCGDMDFKVAGTREGITGFQVDLKIAGLRWDIVESAFKMARKARGEILDFMESILSAPREELSKHAPRIHEIHIDPEKIGALIGPGGKNIRRITETSGAQIDVEPDGKVSIFAIDKESMDMAVREVQLTTAEPEEGVIYNGVVKGVKDFGAFVEIFPGTEGLVHISELADFRVNKVEDICQVGDQMWVKCIGIDERGRVRLSRKAAMAEKDNEGE